MGGVLDPSQALEFGRFRIVPHRRELFVDGRAVELGGRAFDTLLILIEGRGTVLSKDELMRRIWPDRVVEENNLEVQISVLRKVLGTDRGLIRTVAGRRYQFYRVAVGAYRDALALAERLRAVSATLGDLIEGLIGARFVGTILHLLGDQPAARRHVEPALAADFAPTRLQHIARYQWDQRVVAQSFYARIAWLQGDVDRAMRVADDIVEYARSAGHVVSLMYGLSHAACPIAMYTGNLETADSHVRLMQELTAKHGIEAWSMWGRVLEGILLIKRGRSVDGTVLLGRELDGHPTVTFHMEANLVRAELAEGLAATGELERALSTVREAIGRAERSKEGWCLAELRRKEGELLLLTGASSASGDAERCFRQAVEVARRQGALSWELRAATSLARLVPSAGSAHPGPEGPGARGAPVHRGVQDG
jgi:hypothetical protein